MIKERRANFIGGTLRLEVKKATRKHQISHIKVKHLVSLVAFKETMLETYMEHMTNR